MTTKPTGAGAQPAPLTSAEKQRNRTSELDAIAQAHGWQTWTKFETAVKHGLVSIAPNPSRANGKRGGRPRKNTTP